MIVHFKDPKTTVDRDKLLCPQRPSFVGVSAKVEGSTPRMLGQTSSSSTLASTPTKQGSELLGDCDDVGSRPTRLSRFPGRTVKEVDERFQWMHNNRDRARLAERFAAVYRTPFHSSTYHRHHGAWRWLTSSGKLVGDVLDKPWKEVLKQVPAWPSGSRTPDISVLCGSDPPGEFIDLTDDTLGSHAPDLYAVGDEIKPELV